MLRYALLATALPSVASWATCQFPDIDWIVVDSGYGKSATQKVTTLGTDTYIGGYSTGTTILSSSVQGTHSVTNTEATTDTMMDMHISKISDAGAPQAIWVFEGHDLGSSPGWGVLHGMEDGLHIAAATTISGNLTMPSGYSGNDAMVSNVGAQGGTGLVVKLKSDGTIPWYKAFHSAAGSSVSSVDGDAAGNMYVHYRTCVPCVSDCTAETDRYGRPTGFDAPTCTRHLAMLNANDGSQNWKVDIAADTATTSINPGHIRLKRTGGTGAAVKMYSWATVKGAGVTLDACTITSAASGADSQAFLIEWNAATGAAIWCTAPTGDTQVSAGYIDVSPHTSSPVIAVQGSFSGTVAFGSSSITATMGYYTSFIAVLSATDGSPVWAAQSPMGRGVQVTPDNAYVGVFAQTTGTTNSVDLVDANGVTTTVRSRGSWDLIAMKYDATNGNGVYALDGGGDGMEYFHGFGMNSDGDMLISGYSRSSSFHFGDHSLPNNQSSANGGDGANKIFTIQVSATASTPSCISSCANNVPVVAATTCFIDNYCYADQTIAPYPARNCFKCDAATSQTDWTGPDVTDACYITDYSGVSSCYANGDRKPSGRSSSICEACLPEKSTSAWSVKDGYDLVGGSCVALASISTTTTAALTTAMSASTMVKTITGSSGLGTSFAAAKDLYVGSVLQTLATTSWAGTADFDLAAAYYGSATFLDDYMLAALDGTGEFAGTLDSARGDMTAARMEAAKKGLQDQILVMAALSSVAQGPTVEANWDLAYAYYYGDTPGGAPFARADKRAANYGTLAADSIGSPDGTGTAKLNFKILDAIAAGKTACTAGADGAADAEAAAAAAADFRALVLGIYYQASLRYAYKLDNDIAGSLATAEHQGEGGAFWRVVAPLMNSKNPLLTQYVTDFYLMTTVPVAMSRYCPLHFLLTEHFLPGFTSTDFGALTTAAAVNCVSGVQLPAEVPAAVVAAGTSGTEVKAITGSAALGNSSDAGRFAKAKTVYVAGPLDELAKAVYTSTYYTTNVAYFGSATWIDDYMLSALDATGQFAGTLDSARGDMSSARTEAVKKAAQDQIIFNAALGSLVTPTTANSWYMFYAYWTGETPGGAPYARANKRCTNYGTCGGGTSNSDEIAMTNTKILLATLSALDNPTANGAAQAVIATAQAKIVYYQAALRYAYKLDNDMANTLPTAEHQGEGGAFWRVIEAEMAGIDAATSAFVSNFYLMSTVPVVEAGSGGFGRYCPLKQMLESNIPGNFTAAEMGSLTAASAVTCTVAVTANTEGAKKVSKVIKASGTPSDYDANDIGATAASLLGVTPASVVVTIEAATSRRRRLTDGVVITIDVFTSAAGAAAMETSLDTNLGTAAAATTFLTTANELTAARTGGTAYVPTVTEAPAAAASTDASAPAPAAASEGMSTTVLVVIIVAVVVALVVIGGVVMMMMKNKKKTTPGKAGGTSMSA